MNLAKIKLLVLTYWPVVVGICGAVWYLAHGDPATAWACLGFGGAASTTSHALLFTVPPKV